jgi:hypothetical protein
VDVRTFILGALAGYVVALFVPMRLGLSVSGSPRSDRPPGMTGGAPGGGPGM